MTVALTVGSLDLNPNYSRTLNFLSISGDSTKFVVVLLS